MHAGGNSTVGNLLLAWSRSFSNFGERAGALNFFGWSDATVSMPCSWTGVVCDIGGLMLNFTDTGLAGEAILALPAQHKMQHCVVPHSIDHSPPIKHAEAPCTRSPLAGG